MSGEYGKGSKIDDLDTTQPLKRGRAAAPAAVMEPATKPAPKSPGEVGRRGGSGGFVPSETARGSDLVREIVGPQQQTTRRFWIGTLPTCPVAVVTLGGMDFPEYCDPEIKTLGGQLRRAYELGKLVDLTPSKVNAIKEALSRRFIRWSGDGKGSIYCIPTKADIALMTAAGRPVSYPERGDDWLARHVFMVETNHRGDTYPASAYETGIETSAA